MASNTIKTSAYYALLGPNFNVTALISASGTVVERYNYNAYGTPHIYSANWEQNSVGYYYQVY